MNRVEALNLALNALCSQLTEAKINARAEFISPETRKFWKDFSVEAGKAYIQVLGVLVETEKQEAEKQQAQQQREARA